MCGSIHLLSRNMGDGAGWSRIAQCVTPTESVLSTEPDSGAPERVYDIRPAHCSCLVGTHRLHEIQLTTPPEQRVLDASDVQMIQLM